jgi:hypothetical protein
VKIIGRKLLKCGLMTVLAMTATLLIIQPVMAEETAGDSWKFSGSIYGWMPSIKGETAEGEDVDVSFSDLVKRLNLTFMGSVAARKNKLSLLLDGIYMNVEDKSNNTLLQNDLLKLSVTNVQLKAWIVTPMIAYNILNSDRVKLDLLTGARYLYLKADVDLRLKMPTNTTHSSNSASTDFWNGIVGVMGNIKLNEQWYLPFLGDVGTGDTDLTWQVFGGVGYKFENFDLVAGYRHLEWNFDSNDRGGDLLNDLYISGPMVGFRYFF